MKRRVLSVLSALLAFAVLFSAVAVSALPAAVPSVGLSAASPAEDGEARTLTSGTTSPLTEIPPSLSAGVQTDTPAVRQKIEGEKIIATRNPVTVILEDKEYNLLSLTGAAGAFANIKTRAQLHYVLFIYMELGIVSLLRGIAGILPDPPTIRSAEDYESEHFYAGHKTFLNEPARGAIWSLGYAQASLIPADILQKDYYIAGYLFQNFPANKVETVLDDIKVRTIVLDDNSGRGKSSFSNIECIGLSNADVRKIRADLADYAKDNNLVSINITATHTHSSIDTQGLWNPPFFKVSNNLGVSLLGRGEILPGTDTEYMAFLRTQTVATIIAACENMETGSLYYAQKDASKYMFDKRDPASYLGDMTRLRFVPDCESSKETLIVNMGAHPYITGLKTDNSSGKELSADYTAYMGEVIEASGRNFMFFNGAISGVYSDRGPTNDGVPMSRRSEQAERYGLELGRFVLAMTLTREQILADELLADTERVLADMAASTGGYSLWYAGWQPVEETLTQPMMNIRLKEVVVTIDNPLIQAIGKLGLVNNTILKDRNGRYQTVTEIGYLEIGHTVAIAMMPGELSPDLVTGLASATAEGSFSGQPFSLPSMNAVAGKDLIVFGLANDAVGYILPDNDYCMLFFDDVEPFGDHYQETLSFGKSLGSTLVGAFIQLLNEVGRSVL